MNKTIATIVAATLAVGASLLPMAASAQVTPNSPIAARQHRQDVRIRQGVKSGNITPYQASRLRARNSRIRGRAMMDRRMNGGYLTAAQRARLESRMNRTSNAIANRKNP